MKNFVLKCYPIIDLSKTGSKILCTLGEVYGEMCVTFKLFRKL